MTFAEYNNEFVLTQVNSAIANGDISQDDIQQMEKLLGMDMSQLANLGNGDVDMSKLAEMLKKFE